MDKQNLISSFLRILSLLFIIYIMMLSIFFINAAFDQEFGGWTEIGFQFIFAPISTVVGVLFLALPGFFLHRKTNARKDIYHLWIGLSGVAIVWIETIILISLPLTLVK